MMAAHCFSLLLLLVTSSSCVVLVVANNNQLKCFQCEDCQLNRPVAKSCMLMREDRCLKFMGIDKASKHISILVISTLIIALFAVDESRRVIHKRCSSDSGCDYFNNLSNYSVHFCGTCSAQMCNGTPKLSIAVVAAAFLILMQILI